KTKSRLFVEEKRLCIVISGKLHHSNRGVVGQGNKAVNDVVRSYPRQCVNELIVAGEVSARRVHNRLTIDRCVAVFWFRIHGNVYSAGFNAADPVVFQGMNCGSGTSGYFYLVLDRNYAAGKQVDI